MHRLAGDQWLLASQSISLNMAEGNGKTAEADRAGSLEIARGSAMECAAIQDILVAGKGLDGEASRGRKTGLDRIAAMLSRLRKSGCCLKEASTPCGCSEFDFDPDSDFDPDEIKSRQADGLNTHSSRP